MRDKNVIFKHVFNSRIFILERFISVLTEMLMIECVWSGWWRIRGEFLKC